jgi:hypothetical protein
MSKLSELKAKYKVFISLKENSGFGWDDVKKMPTAPEEIWAKYIEANPKAKIFRFKSLPYFLQLESLFEGKVAQGKFTLSSLTISDIVEPLCCHKLLVSRFENPFNVVR